MIIKVGDIFQANEGGSVTVVGINGCESIMVISNDNHLHLQKKTAQSLRLGRIKNPYKKSVYGVGFLGAGKYKAKRNERHDPAYRSWHSMMQRAYDPKYLKIKPTYNGCKVSEEWQNYQNYAEWFYSQGNSQKKGFQIDKDLRIIGNKIYCKEACSFMPLQINVVLNDRGALRGIYPQGVTSHYLGFRASISVRGSVVLLGTHSTPEAASIIYKKAKENYLKEMAEQYRADIHPEVYNNLSTWECK